jgi:hypothetical protein
MHTLHSPSSSTYGITKHMDHTNRPHTGINTRHPTSHATREREDGAWRMVLIFSRSYNHYYPLIQTSMRSFPQI